MIRQISKTSYTTFSPVTTIKFFSVIGSCSTFPVRQFLHSKDLKGESILVSVTTEGKSHPFIKSKRADEVFRAATKFYLFSHYLVNGKSGFLHICTKLRARIKSALAVFYYIRLFSPFLQFSPLCLHIFLQNPLESHFASFLPGRKQYNFSPPPPIHV